MVAIRDAVQAEGMCWNLGPLALIPLGEGRTFQLGTVAVSVFRARDGAVYATQAACTHLGGPLADGLVGTGRVICPLHGYQFDLATGQPVGHSCPALRTYAVRISAAGHLLVTLSARGTAA